MAPCPGGRVPGERLLDRFAEMPRAQARLRPAGSPDVNRPVRPPDLGQAAAEREHVAHVVGVQVGDEHLVERVHRQLQARVVREGTGPQVENQNVALGIADFDQDAGRSLGAGRPRIAAAEHRHAQLAVLEGFLARDEHLGVFCRGVPTTGVRVIAFVPPS